MSKYALSLFVAMLFASCTINLLQTDTHGTASDVVDETDSASANVSPTVSTPLTPAKVNLSENLRQLAPATQLAAAAEAA